MTKSNDHISTEEIKQDIADTNMEIETMQREIKGFELLGDKMSMFRADARRYGIQERKEFIKKLNDLLQARADQ